MRLVRAQLFCEEGRMDGQTDRQTDRYDDPKSRFWQASCENS